MYEANCHRRQYAGRYFYELFVFFYFMINIQQMNTIIKKKTFYKLTTEARLNKYAFLLFDKKK